MLMNEIKGIVSVPDKIVGNIAKQAVKITGSVSKPSGSNDYEYTEAYLTFDEEIIEIKEYDYEVITL